jgi:large subunit ribosomal protein L11
MAAKKILKNIKLKAPAQKATPAPPLGPALGQAGVNIADFVQKFNAATQGFTPGETVGVKIRVFEDRTYEFDIKTPPVVDMLAKAAGVEKGSGKPHLRNAGKITKAQLKEIAERKMPDLNANDIEGAMKIVAGSARSAGFTIVD